MHHSCAWYMHHSCAWYMAHPFIKAPITAVYFLLFYFLAFPVYGVRRPPPSASGLFGGSAGNSAGSGGGRGTGKSDTVVPSKVATDPVHSIPWLQLMAAVLEAYPAGGCWRPEVRDWCCVDRRLQWSPSRVFQGKKFSSGASFPPNLSRILYMWHTEMLSSGGFQCPGGWFTRAPVRISLTFSSV